MLTFDYGSPYFSKSREESGLTILTSGVGQAVSSITYIKCVRFYETDFSLLLTVDQTDQTEFTKSNLLGATFIIIVCVFLTTGFW